MTTPTEDLIKQLKRSARSKAILVPRIEKFMQKGVEVDDELDRQYLATLVEARSQPRRKGIYSPSALADCVRKVYFIKTGVPRKTLARPDANAIFLDGNFRHFKWQFVMWKMHRAGIIQLVDVGSVCLGAEIFVGNEKGDYGGTLDNLIYIPDINLVTTVDWKGMNGNSFIRSVDKGPSLGYAQQSVGYAGLANDSLRDILPKKIESVLIIGENKNGAVRTRIVNSPLGLFEWKLNLDDYKHIVAKRLKRLRVYEREDEIPPPECVSTRRMMFKDCPFNKHCLGEIQVIEKKTQRYKAKNPKAPPKVVLNKTARKKNVARKKKS